MNEQFLNKITQGDCKEVLKNIADKSVDCVVIDPPYEISVSHGSGAFGVEKKLHYQQFEEISFGFDESILDELCRVMKKINIYIFCSKNQLFNLIDYFVNKKGCNWTPLRWIKTNPVPACGNSYMSDSEYCLFFREKGVKVYGTAESKKTYFISAINISDKKIWEHPTIKPLTFVKNLIFNSTQENETVLDCFSGSGTTAVAALQLKRNFIAIELKDKYCELSRKRIELETQQTKLF